MNKLKNKVFLLAIIVFALVHLVLYFLQLDALIILVSSFLTGLILFSIGFNVIETGVQKKQANQQELSERLLGICQELDLKVNKIETDKQGTSFNKGLEAEIRKIQSHLQENQDLLGAMTGSKARPDHSQGLLDHQLANVGQDTNEMATLSDEFKNNLATLSDEFKNNLATVEVNSNASYNILKDSQVALDQILKFLIGQEEEENKV